MHLLSSKQITLDQLESLFQMAAKMEDNPSRAYRLQDKIIATLFHERSTRTRLSFESAAIRLGANVLTEDAESSSTGKGESLSDTLRTVSQYADIIVLRSPCNIRNFLDRCEVPIISAGDGDNEHPTQAMLDMFTIWRSQGLERKIKLVIVGDLYGRTVRSLIHLLRMFNNVDVWVVPSKASRDSERLLFDKQLLECLERPLTFIDSKDTLRGLEGADVVYMTRRQHERYADDMKSTDGDFVLSKRGLKSLKETAIIMHPMPRCSEISRSVDDDPRALYHSRQIKNGLYVRMALLYLVGKCNWLAGLRAP